MKHFFACPLINEPTKFSFRESYRRFYFWIVLGHFRLVLRLDVVLGFLPLPSQFNKEPPDDKGTDDRIPNCYCDLISIPTL